MPDYERLYHMLFAAADDAASALEAQDYGEARRILVGVLQDCEEQVVSGEEDTAG